VQTIWTCCRWRLVPLDTRSAWTGSIVAPLSDVYVMRSLHSSKRPISCVDRACTARRMAFELANAHISL
jgi:hypothetical protein